jgi:hypothetical protein
MQKQQTLIVCLMSRDQPMDGNGESAYRTVLDGTDGFVQFQVSNTTLPFMNQKYISQRYLTLIYILICFVRIVLNLTN